VFRELHDAAGSNILINEMSLPEFLRGLGDREKWRKALKSAWDVLQTGPRQKSVF
jgi:hypothetical protein